MKHCEGEPAPVKEDARKRPVHQMHETGICRNEMKKQGRTKTKSHTPELMNQFCGGTALRETQSCIRDTPEHETSDKREKKTMRLPPGGFWPDPHAPKEVSKSYGGKKERLGVH